MAHTLCTTNTGVDCEVYPSITSALLSDIKPLSISGLRARHCLCSFASRIVQVGIS